LAKKFAFLFCAAIALFSLACWPAGPKEPGGTRADAYTALNDPDEYAWQLFFFLNRPSQKNAAGIPDRWRKFGEVDPDIPVVWETWALASGGDASEVFLRDGRKPDWSTLNRTQEHPPLTLTINLERQMVEEQLREKLRQYRQRNNNTRRKRRTGLLAEKCSGGSSADAKEQEVRINHAAFASIVDQRMFSADGLENLLEKARQTGDRSLIDVQKASKEVKAEWLPLDESQKNRYFWRYGPTGPDGKRQLYGLVALHIITKDLPNWFWADFGHRDCEEGRAGCSRFCADNGNEPRDRTTRGPNGSPGPHGVQGVRKETEGTVWANYILRGTQTDFVTATGQPTVLSNPVIEDFEQISSCMTCHSRATVGTRKAGSQFVNSLEQDTEPSVPDPAWFRSKESPIEYLQTDFMWSPVVFAQREKPSN
jgi:hypothetical protein